MEIATRSETQPRGNNRATYVLVHGGWHGSWCWKRVRKALQDAGHEVFTPSLTGVCERSHLNSATVNLATHIADVVNPSPVGGTLGCDSPWPLLRWFRDQRRRRSNLGPKSRSDLGVASLASRTSPISLRQNGVAQVAHQFRPLTNARR